MKRGFVGLCAVGALTLALPGIAVADPSTVSAGCFGQAVTTTVTGGARGQFLGVDGVAAASQPFGEVQDNFKLLVCGQQTAPINAF
jgi:hypothetical protein